MHYDPLTLWPQLVQWCSQWPPILELWFPLLLILSTLWSLFKLCAPSVHIRFGAQPRNKTLSTVELSRLAKLLERAATPFCPKGKSKSKSVAPPLPSPVPESPEPEPEDPPTLESEDSEKKSAECVVRVR